MRSFRAPLVAVLSFAFTVPLAVAELAAAAEAKADLYVSPDGRDTWSGGLAEPNATNTDGPLATLDAARQAVRKLDGRDHRDVTVLVRGGTYRLERPVVFSLEDSAADGHTISYAAYPGEQPIVSSGRPVAGWRKLTTAPAGLCPKARGKVWVADVSSFGTFYTLFDGDRALPRASSAGFVQVNETPRGSNDFQTVEFPLNAIPGLANPTDAELRIIPSHFWTMNLLPIASIDYATGTLETTVSGTYPLGRNGMTDRPTAWVENALEVLDQPGEWMLDSSAGLLYLWPSGDEPGESVVAPALTELIRVEGRIDYEGPDDTPVTGLIFRGLDFRHGDRFAWHGRTGWGLQHDWECFDKPTALVRFRGAADCAIEDCRFAHSGHTAIRLDLCCLRNRIAGNQIHDIGGAGVLLAGYGPGTKDVNRQNEVVDNYIHHIGREYWGFGAIFAWQSGENHIAYNHIHHIPYTAILATGRIIRTQPGPAECSRTIRWNEVPEMFAKASWAEREPYLHARKNVIEYNDIHNAMEKLGDGNCIYVSGAGGGNVVRHNYCHDCDGAYMNAAIRCDDDQHGTLMEDNIICRTAGYGEGFISKGDNDILNNVVADLRSSERHRGYIVFPYGDIRGSAVEHNILYSRNREQTPYYLAQGSTRHGKPPRLSDTQADRNLYFNTETNDWAAEHFKSERPSGNERHSLEADPQFVEVAAGDFRFGPDSPAARLGIEPLDSRQAGLRSPYRQQFVGKMIRTQINPAGARFRKPITVQIFASDPEAQIRYTLDGSEPDGRSAVYAGPFTLESPGVVRAMAFAEGATDLIGASATFTPPPAPIVEDFESTPVGRPTYDGNTHEDPKLQQFTARITNETAAAGRHSLKFIDGPGQTNSFTPHIFYRRTYAEGRMLGRFDVRIDSQASFSYQWRQYEDGYRTGPTVSVMPGGRLVHGDKTLLTLPLDQWVRFEVGGLLGDRADGTFTMRVWLPGRDQPVEFGDLACSPEFTRLDWVGFASKADQEAVYYVDNIEVRAGNQ